MPLLHILILAIVQGVTEFLPISSSGHLLIIPYLTGWPDQGQVIDIAVHVGSLVAVIAYFWRDVAAVLNALLRPGNPELTEGRKLAGHVLIATIPVIVAGGLLYLLLTTELRSILLVAATTILFGIWLGWADKYCVPTKTFRSMTVVDALIIGFFQVFALLPGTSRSGVTMMAARIRGLDRVESAHFSMLLSIPTIVGAGTLGTISLIRHGNLEVGIDAIIAAVVSAVVAFCTISLLMNWINRIGFQPFVIYRLILGVVLLALYFLA